LNSFILDDESAGRDIGTRAANDGSGTIGLGHGVDELSISLLFAEAGEKLVRTQALSEMSVYGSAITVGEIGE